MIPYLPRHWTVWECAAGEGQLAAGLEMAGYRTVSSDIREGQDFMDYQPASWDCIVTNPPYNSKERFLERSYELGKPFALLLPLTALEGQKRQKMYRKHGMQLILLPERVYFKTPDGKSARAWFAVAWFTNGLDIAQEITYYGL